MNIVRIMWLVFASLGAGAYLGYKDIISYNCEQQEAQQDSTDLLLSLDLEEMEEK